MQTVEKNIDDKPKSSKSSKPSNKAASKTKLQTPQIIMKKMFATLNSII